MTECAKRPAPRRLRPGRRSPRPERPDRVASHPCGERGQRCAVRGCELTARPHADGGVPEGEDVGPLAPRGVDRAPHGGPPDKPVLAPHRVRERLLRRGSQEGLDPGQDRAILDVARSARSSCVTLRYGTRRRSASSACAAPAATSATFPTGTWARRGIADHSPDAASAVVAASISRPRAQPFPHTGGRRVASASSWERGRIRASCRAYPSEIGSHRDKAVDPSGRICHFSSRGAPSCLRIATYP
jgi:hypothetical protein